MDSKRFVGCMCLLGLLLATGIALAQEDELPPVPEAEEEGVPEASYSIKQISLSVFGGWFSGATYLELPPLEARTELAEGSNDIYMFDGSIFQLPTYYDAPQKKIDAGTAFGGRIGFYLSDEFHLDLITTITRTKAVTSFQNNNPRDPKAPFREVMDTDDGFTVYQGGGALMYDVTTADLLGLHPYFGLGLGGIINHFSHIADKTALYFELITGLSYNLKDDLQLRAQFNATTLSFEREELRYAKQVTYAQASLGITWLINTTPKM